jgi:hypothetical protein
MTDTFPCPRCNSPGPHLPVPGASPPHDQCGRCLRQGVIQDVWAPPDPDGDGVTTPILRHLPPAFRTAARQLLTATPARSALLCVPWRLQILFVAANVPLLKACGLYERDLLRAYQGSSGWPLDTLWTLVLQADVARLRAAADPVPDPPPTTLYRGVSGSKAVRRVRGFAWTSSLPCACWFALRQGTADPAVYALAYRDAPVLAYLKSRQEEEYLCYALGLRRAKRLPLTREAMAAYTAEWEAQREQF